MIAHRSMTEAYRREKFPRVYAMSTFFYKNLMLRGPSALERWTKNVDIFESLILVPVHVLDEHWCLALVHFRCPGIFYYDSIGGHNMPALSLILDYLKVEYKKKRNADLNIKKYVKEVVADCPKQENLTDCGIFACKVAEVLAKDATPRFHSEFQFINELTGSPRTTSIMKHPPPITYLPTFDYSLHSL